jgi:hypothetical protein
MQMAGKAKTSEPGYDGKPPVFMLARDIDSRDRLTGRTVRETPAGPENVNNSRVSALLARKQLSRRQFDAAMMFFKDWHDSEILTVASAHLIRVDGNSGRTSLSDHKLDAQTRHVKARKWLSREYGGRFLAIVEKVVLEEKTVEFGAAELRIHHQRAASLLECGCDALGDCYGLAWA